jgi:hypothetical protein
MMGVQMRTIRDGLLLLACLVASPVAAHAQCTECAAEYTAFPGHGTSGDGRRIIKVKIDSSWGNPTNSKIWNATRDAVDMWNDATDQYNNKTGYFFVLDQNEGSPEITVKKGSCPLSVACATFNNSGSPGEIKLVEGGDYGGMTSEYMDDDTRKQALGHEIGHAIGLTKQLCANSSVMAGLRVTQITTSSGPQYQLKNRTLGVYADDVAAANRALNSPSTQCAGNRNDASIALEDDGSIGGGGYDDEPTGGGPQEECFATWHVTYYFYWNGSGWSFDYASYDYIVGINCYPLPQ